MLGINHLFTTCSQDSLIETLRRTCVHFVHCLLPQNFAGLCDLKSGQRLSLKSSDDDVILNVPLLRSQIRGHQLIEAVRIYRQGKCWDVDCSMHCHSTSLLCRQGEVRGEKT